MHLSHDRSALLPEDSVRPNGPSAEERSESDNVILRQTVMA